MGNFFNKAQSPYTLPFRDLEVKANQCPLPRSAKATKSSTSKESQGAEDIQESAETPTSQFTFAKHSKDTPIPIVKEPEGNKVTQESTDPQAPSMTPDTSNHAPHEDFKAPSMPTTLYGPKFKPVDREHSFTGLEKDLDMEEGEVEQSNKMKRSSDLVGPVYTKEQEDQIHHFKEVSPSTTFTP